MQSPRLDRRASRATEAFVICECFGSRFKSESASAVGICTRPLIKVKQSGELNRRDSHCGRMWMWWLGLARLTKFTVTFEFVTPCRFCFFGELQVLSSRAVESEREVSKSLSCSVSALSQLNATLFGGHY